MNFLKIISILANAGSFLTLTGRLLFGLGQLTKSVGNTISQDSSIPNGEEDEKPAEDVVEPDPHQDY